MKFKFRLVEGLIKAYLWKFQGPDNQILTILF